VERLPRRRPGLFAAAVGLALFAPDVFAQTVPANGVQDDAQRAAKKREVASFGMIDLVKSDAASARSTSPWWTREDLAPTAASLAMWTAGIGETPAGLTLSSIGLGAGGSGEGSRQRGVSTVGGGSGVDDLDAFDHRGRMDAAARAKARPVNPRPPDAIQRVVRDNFDAMRLCYDWGLRSDGGLHGRVAVKFSIARDGTVPVAADTDSDLPDAEVVNCVVRVFLNLGFPPSSAGPVTVIYPLRFDPP
jgi:hypothetical protein